MSRSSLKRLNITSASHPIMAGPGGGDQPNQTTKGAIMAKLTRKNNTNKSPINFIKRHKTVFSCIAGAIVVAPFAAIAAPVIAAAAGAAGVLGTTATAGTAISSLAGAALTNASLAALGNGALIIGGGGMAGGTAVIAGAGAAAGAVAGASTSAADRKLQNKQNTKKS